MLLGSTVLEVAMGLFFVYLLLSLLCSAIGEYIEAKVNNRAKYLRQGIALLLNDTDEHGKSDLANGKADLAHRLYNHGLIRPLYRDRNTLPSYIPSRTFALAVWNLATGAAASADGAPQGGVTTDLKKIRDVVESRIPNLELRSALLTLIDEANGDIEKARRNIEDWYDAMMDRVSGWYKRTTSHLLLVLGFVIAAAVNADTISMARALAYDGALRTSIVGAAQQRLTALQTASPAAPSGAADAGVPGATAADAAEADTENAAQDDPATDVSEKDRIATENIRQARAALGALGLPLGWSGWSAERGDPRRAPDDLGGWLLKFLGICLTGFAVSQGAPFWFDLLNKFIVIRSTVKPSEKSQPQPSKDRPAPTTAVEQDQRGDESASKD
jgi:hypothetical protein